jgi:hypothetical protein
MKERSEEVKAYWLEKKPKLIFKLICAGLAL